jgi:hypothetical protein
MNDHQQTTEFVFRRLEEPLNLFGQSLPPWVWIVALGVVLAVGFFYIAWMYIREARTLGPWWAILLGLLRASVYALIGFVFLLPAKQTWNESRQRSKVVLVFDVSGSVTVSRDDVPPPGKSLLDVDTRQDQVLKFLHNEDRFKGFDFIKRLEEKNPITAYRFSKFADPDFRHLNDGRFWPSAERKLVQNAKSKDEAPAGYELTREHWRTWLTPLTLETLPAEWTGGLPRGWKADELRAKELLRQVKANKDLMDVKVRFFDGTAVGESLQEVIKQERNQMVQGIIVFTDGRSTEGSLQAVKDAATNARDASIPVFVVALGEDRPKVAIDIVDVRVPPLIRPEDKWPVAVQINGQDMPNEEFELELDVIRITRTKEGKIVQKPIELVRIDDKGQILKRKGADGKDEDDKFVLTDNKVTLPANKFSKDAPKNPTFKPGNPPTAQVEFQLDAATLAKAANKMVEGKVGMAPDDDSELRFIARVKKDKREITEVKDWHVSEPADMRVQKKPLRVLLVASAATREYQFMRTLLVREMDKGRAEMCIYLQTLPETERRTGIVQDVDPSRILGYFPTKRRATAGTTEGPYYSLSSYDVVVFFDTNWKEFSKEQLKLINEWVYQDGGGVVVIAGGMNTVELGRPVPRAALPANPKDRPNYDVYPLLYIRTMLPVVPEDARITDIKTDKPRRLIFPQATSEQEFMRLDDNLPRSEWKKSWQKFFDEIQDEDGKATMADPLGTPERGFYWCFPSKSVKQNALVLASFDDPTVTMPDKKTPQPFLVSGPWGDGKVVWLADGEMWHLRSYRDGYHERFWTKLLRDVGSKSVNTLNKRITPVMSRYGVVNKFQTFEARFQDLKGDPLPRNVNPPPRLLVTLPEGVPAQKGDLVIIKEHKEPEYVGKQAKVLDIIEEKGPDGSVVRKLKVGSIGGDPKSKVINVLATATELTIPPIPFKPRIPVKQNEGASEADTLNKSNDGWFKLEFQPRAAGEYKMKVVYEDSPDNVYPHKFLVKESNPEIQNAQPDRAALWELASSADLVLNRISDDSVRQELRSKLLAGPQAKADAGAADKGKGSRADTGPRLLFDLDGAKVIPSCMKTDRKDLRNRGKVQDLWDDGFVVWSDPEGEKNPVKLSYVLLLVVGLLSVEWLIRKLLRLA